MILMASIIKSFFWLLTLLFLINIHCASGSTYAEIQENLDKAMQSACNHEQFSGAVLIAVDEKIIFENACGLANRSLNVANNINTKFNLGSVGKLFTSVAITQLIQQKKISFPACAGMTSGYAMAGIPFKIQTQSALSLAAHFLHDHHQLEQQPDSIQSYHH
jgi:hypothetical protein